MTLQKVIQNGLEVRVLVTPHQLSGKVITVDVSEVVGGVAEHSYHVESEPVGMDLIAVLKGEKADSIPSRIYVPHANKFRLVKSN